MDSSNLCFFACAAVMFSGGCYPSGNYADRALVVRRVNVIEVHFEPRTEQIELLGKMEPGREVMLYFEVAGVVADVMVEEGQLVAAGTPLAQLVLDDFELAVEKARSELSAGEARLALLDAGTRKEDIEAANASHAAANANLTYWKLELARLRKLQKKSVVTDGEIDLAVREWSRADQQQRSAKALLDRAIAGPRKEEKDEATATVHALDQTLALAKRQLEKGTLVAPFAGRIERLLVDPGAYVNVFPMGGVPIIHLIDSQHVDAVLSVPESLREHMRQIGQLEVISAANPELKGIGSVVSLTQGADPDSGTHSLRVRVANDDGRFASGMVVVGRVTGETLQSILIPVASIRDSYSAPPTVMLVDRKSGTVNEREISPGQLFGDMIEVKTGLGGGELVIVAGQHRVIPGDVVKYETLDGRSATP